MSINISENLSRWLKPAIHTNQFDSAWYEKRVDTIKSIIEEIKPLESLNLLRYFLGLSTNEDIIDIESKLQGEDLAFERGNTFLNRLIIGACLIDILNTSSYSSDAISLAYSSYNFQSNSSTPETELEADLKVITQNYLRSECVRVREVNNSFKKIDDLSKKNLNFNTLKKGLGEDLQLSQPNLQKVANSLFEVATKIQTDYSEKINTIVGSYNKEVANLSNQIEITKEETDLLWWLFGEFSRDIEKPFNEFSLPSGCLLIGKEAADLTKFVPGHPSAKAFIHRALNILTSKSNTSLSPKTQLSFASVIEEDIQDWEMNWLSNESVNYVLDFAPIHQALRSKIDSHKTSWRKKFEVKSKLKTNQKFQALDISYQFYQERLLVRIVSY